MDQIISYKHTHLRVQMNNLDFKAFYIFDINRV